jgi:hypothetical protein
LWFLTQKLRLSVAWTIVGIVVLTGIITFGAGSLVSYVMYPDALMIRVFDPQHVYYAVIVHLIYIPAMWFVYFWQPRALVDTLSSLREQNVIADEGKPRFEELSERMRLFTNRWYWPVLAALAVSAIVALQTVWSFPQQAGALGKVSFWLYDARFYWLNTAVWFLSYYVTAMVAIKGMLTLGWFFYLFRKLQVHLDISHADGVGGMGALGRLAARYSAIGIGIGVIAASYTLMRLWIGAGWLYADTAVLYVLYLLVTPAALLMPIWSAHERMVEARCHLLSKLSGEIDVMLCKMLDAPDEPPPPSWSLRFLGIEVVFRRGAERADREYPAIERRLQKLQARYGFVADQYPTWPIRIAFARNLTIVGSVPLFTAVIGLLADVY